MIQSKRSFPASACFGIGLLLFLLLLSACGTDQVQTLEQQKLFSIPIGKMEDQLDVYYDGISSFDDKIRVVMQDGIVFIANGRGRKVMEFSSYGDILSLYYNSDYNPPPVLLNEAGSGGEVSSRVALAFPFLEVGEIAVTPSGLLMVEDSIPQNRADFDEERGAFLNRVVRRFDLSGAYIDYLGQEGIGGTPFPYIESIHVNRAEEPIIICRAEASWIVYWFNREGNLKYEVTVPMNDLPLPAEEDLIPALERIVPDDTEELLYIKIDTYKEVRESLGGTGTRIDYFASYFFWLNPKSGAYEGYLEVPHVVRKQEIPGIGAEQDEEVLYEFLGVAGGGFFFLLGPFGPDQYQILVVDETGVVLDRPRISLRDRDIFYRDFYLSRDGILTALLCREFEADLVWWRTDQLLEERRDEAR